MFLLAKSLIVPFISLRVFSRSFAHVCALYPYFISPQSMVLTQPVLRDRPLSKDF